MPGRACRALANTPLRFPHQLLRLQRRWLGQEDNLCYDRSMPNASSILLPGFGWSRGQVANTEQGTRQQASQRVIRLVIM
jgi:hypothetical protein